ILALGAIFVYATFRLRGRTRFWTICTLICVGILFAIVWGPFMLAQRGSLGSGDDWVRVSEPNHLLQTLRRLAILPMLMLFNPQRYASAIIYASCVVLVIPLFLLRRRPQLWLWVIWFWATVGPMVAMELVRGTRHLDFLRYTLLAAPALYVVLAEFVPPSSPRSFSWMRQAVPAIVTLCCGLSLSATYYP